MRLLNVRLLLWFGHLCALVRSQNKKVSVKEVVFDSPVADIQWLGNDHKTVVLLTQKGRLYRSHNSGDNWNDITDQLKVEAAGAKDSKAVAVDALIPNPADKNIILVVGTKRNHFISQDAGKTWRRLRQRATIHTFLFHPTRARWAMLSSWTDACNKKEAKENKENNPDAVPDEGPCNHMLYITKDLGRSFTLVSSYVVQFNWGDKSLTQQDRIYFTHFRQKKGDQPKLSLWSRMVDFAHSDDAGSTVTRLVYRGNKFLISNGFIFVAKLKDATSQTVTLMSSVDGGKTFNPAKLPVELEEKSYTVLDTSEGAVVLHVNHGSKEPYGVGNIYISDKEGVRFALSLPNNVRSTAGDCEFDKVMSLEGVYMANFKDVQTGDNQDTKKAEENKKADDMEKEAAAGTEVDKRRTTSSKSKDNSVIRTVISFDKGGIWSYLKPPKVDSLGKTIECPPDRCWLHLHGVTNFHNYAPFYSLESAVGIIMGTGNIGPYLRFEPDQTNTYLSRDGGLSWVEAHKGAFIYEFGDHGGLLIMADDIHKTKQVVFSWNEGQSWYDFEISEFPLEVDNIVTEPNATSTKFLLYGTRGDTGVLYHLDFEALGQPLCKGVWAADSVSSDYETWQPSDGRNSESCILGRQISYTRRKATSECFNGEKFERPTVRKNCVCTEEDYECEMGFARKVGSTECRPVDDTTSAPEGCTTSDFYYVDAYRKVVGDSCDGGWAPQKVAVPCPSGSRFSSGAMSVLGVTGMIVIMMVSIQYLSKSEKFKHLFANYGFENFTNVKYAGIGQKAPESAMDSVGLRYDADFIDADQDEFNDDAPKLMHYNTGGATELMNREDDRQMVAGAVHTTTAAVPRLMGPPGGGMAPAPAAPSHDDGMDLL